MTLRKMIDTIIELKEQNERNMMVLGNLIFSESKSADNTEEFISEFSKYRAANAKFVDLSNELGIIINRFSFEGTPMNSIYAQRDKLAHIEELLGHIVSAPEQLEGPEKEIKFLALDTDKINEIYEPLAAELEEVADTIERALDEEIDNG